MCDNKMKRIDNSNGILEMVLFDCQEVKNLKDEWLRDFIDVNCPDEFKIDMDRAYCRYEEKINSFISSCKDQPERLSEKGPQG